MGAKKGKGRKTRTALTEALQDALKDKRRYQADAESSNKALSRVVAQFIERGRRIHELETQLAKRNRHIGRLKQRLAERGGPTRGQNPEGEATGIERMLAHRVRTRGLEWSTRGLEWEAGDAEQAPTMGSTPQTREGWARTCAEMAPAGRQWTVQAPIPVEQLQVCGREGRRTIDWLVVPREQAARDGDTDEVEIRDPMAELVMVLRTGSPWPQRDDVVEAVAHAYLDPERDDGEGVAAPRRTFMERLHAAAAGWTDRWDDESAVLRSALMEAGHNIRKRFGPERAEIRIEGAEVQVVIDGPEVR